MNYPNQRILFLFPGQGSQYLGMGQDLYQAYDCVRQTYHEASEILGYDMAALSFEDPQEQIHLTRYTQPALLTHSVACLRIFQELLARPISAEASAGHSLGEYTALVAAGALEFKTALNLVHHRGTLMGNYGAGEMEALPLGLKEAELLAEKHFSSIAACNLPDQTVVGGLSEDLDKLVGELTEQFPKKRSSRLKTEGAFHTYYMVEAARRFRLILDKAPLIPPQIRVLSNYTGGFHDDDPDIIKSRLFWQLTNPVRWHENLISALDSGLNTFVEFGGGIGKGETPADKKPNLAAIIKKATRKADAPPTYHAVINADTLLETASLFQSQ